MKDPHTIVLKPLITEKCSRGMEKHLAYTFKVASDANRIDIRRAVEQIFEVKVKKVNTSWQRGKRKRVGRSIGTTRGYKKAIITLVPGHKIDVY
ncbi:MAG: 50S ribosomal protein L23 [Planctomycetes bacterium]|nr:50S ribosomal protein L23 [Planctomycetota bacterium]